MEVILVYRTRLRIAKATKRKPVNKKTKARQIAGGRGRNISVSSRTAKAIEKTLSWKNKQGTSVIAQVSLALPSSQSYCLRLLHFLDYRHVLPYTI